MGSLINDHDFFHFHVNIIWILCFKLFDQFSDYQGMSDLLSPILFVIEDESESFWCFAALMERLGPNFNRDQSGMHSQLFALSKVLFFAILLALNIILRKPGSNLVQICYSFIMPSGFVIFTLNKNILSYLCTLSFSHSYMLLPPPSIPKIDITRFTNNDSDWSWLLGIWFYLPAVVHHFV